MKRKREQKKMCDVERSEPKETRFWQRLQAWLYKTSLLARRCGRRKFDGGQEVCRLGMKDYDEKARRGLPRLTVRPAGPARGEKHRSTRVFHC